MAQPVIAFSTIPPLVNGGLRPRHADLRPFAVNDGDDVWVLPGGLTRVALPEGELVVNSSQGGGSKDTWVVDGGSPVHPSRDVQQIVMEQATITQAIPIITDDDIADAGTKPTNGHRSSAARNPELGPAPEPQREQQQQQQQQQQRHEQEEHQTENRQRRPQHRDITGISNKAGGDHA
jgi:hypothetical protein